METNALKMSAAALLQARKKPASDYTWYRYAGPDRSMKSARGKVMPMTKGTVFGVRTSSDKDKMRLIFKELGDGVIFSLTPRVVDNLLAKSKEMAVFPGSVGGAPKPQKAPIAPQSEPRGVIADVKQLLMKELLKGYRKKSFDWRAGYDPVVTIAKSPVTSPAVLSALADQSDWVVQVFVAGNEATPAAVLAKLAGNKAASVRAAVAGNPKTPKKLLKQLEKDRDEDVRFAVFDAA